MRVDVRQKDQVIIVDLEGLLVAGTGDEVLREIFDELVGSKWDKIVLNLSEVTRVDSAGVGELVASIKMAERFGSKVKLINLGDAVRHILELSQILPLIEVYDSEEEAIEAFDADESPPAED